MNSFYDNQHKKSCDMTHFHVYKHNTCECLGGKIPGYKYITKISSTYLLFAAESAGLFFSHRQRNLRERKNVLM